MEICCKEACFMLRQCERIETRTNFLLKASHRNSTPISIAWVSQINSQIFLYSTTLPRKYLGYKQVRKRRCKAMGKEWRIHSQTECFTSASYTQFIDYVKCDKHLLKSPTFIPFYEILHTAINTNFPHKIPLWDNDCKV